MENTDSRLLANDIEEIAQELDKLWLSDLGIGNLMGTELVELCCLHLYAIDLVGGSITLTKKFILVISKVKGMTRQILGLLRR